MKVLIFISLLLFSYIKSNISICDISNKEKKNCGFFGINQKTCEESGCCYKVTPDGSPWCFHKKTNIKNNFIQKVLDEKKRKISNEDEGVPFEEIDDDDTPL